MPWCTLGSTNRKVVEDPEIIIEATLERLQDLLGNGNEIFRMSPEDLIKRNICDPVKVFIKDEPHKWKKLNADKLRIISNVSVVDQIIDRLLFKEQNSFEIQNWQTCPSKPGIGLDDFGLQCVSENLRELLDATGSIRSTDVSGWDWSVQEWEFDADLECRLRLGGVPMDSLCGFLMRCRVHCLKNKVFAIPDGRLVAQTDPGIQASGSLNTSSTNSRMRILLRLVAYIASCDDRGLEPDLSTTRCIAMGDDSAEVNEDDDLVKYIEKFGHVISDNVVTTEVAGTEFCSNKWREDGLAIPVNVWKTAFRYFSHPPNSTTYLEWYAQLRNDLRNVTGLDRLFEVARAHAECAKEICLLPVETDARAAQSAVGRE